MYLGCLQTISTWNILARVISAKNHRNILARAPFGTADVPADGHFNTGTSRHGDFSAWGFFGTRNFRHRNISAWEHFGTWTFWHSSTGLCRNVHIALQGAKISMCRRNVPVLKIHCAENSPCQYFPMSKGSPVETSICQNIRSAERCMCRNVPVMTHQCRNGL